MSAANFVPTMPILTLSIFTPNPDKVARNMAHIPENVLIKRKCLNKKKMSNPPPAD
jgi:hypothetical protein